MCAEPPRRLGKALGQPDRIDLGIVGAVGRAPEVCRQQRLGLSRLFNWQQFDLQAGLFLFGNQPLQQLGLFFRFGHDHAAAGHVFDVIVQFRRQRSVQRGALHRQVQMRPRVLRLQNDKPVAGAGGAGSDIAPVQQYDPLACFGRVVGDRGANDAAADYDYIRGLIHRRHLRPALPVTASLPGRGWLAAECRPVTDQSLRRSPD